MPILFIMLVVGIGAYPPEVLNWALVILAITVTLGYIAKVAKGG